MDRRVELVVEEIVCDAISARVGCSWMRAAPQGAFVDRAGTSQAIVPV